MTMTVEVARLRIARELLETEEAMDQALLKSTTLMTTLLASRVATGVARHVGYEALLKLNKSQQAMLTADGGIARVHGTLSTVQREVAGIDDCPENVPMVGLQLEQKTA